MISLKKYLFLVVDADILHSCSLLLSIKNKATFFWKRVTFRVFKNVCFSNKIGKMKMIFRTYLHFELRLHYLELPFFCGRQDCSMLYCPLYSPGRHIPPSFISTTPPVFPASFHCLLTAVYDTSRLTNDLAQWNRGLS